jgi:endonuclease YncB( thermonuclease family)
MCLMTARPHPPRGGPLNRACAAAAPPRRPWPRTTCGALLRGLLLLAALIGPGDLERAPGARGGGAGALALRAARADEPQAPPTEAPPAEPAAAPTAAAASPLVIGVFPVTPAGVIDGDTLRTEGAKESIRILILDTEEIFHSEKDRVDAERDFDAYARAKRGEEARPVKYGTPAGEAAKRFAQTLLKGVARVRLERDAEDAPTHGSYGRLLAHVILLRPDGSEVNYAEAVIRAGHSPYFVKYGGSVRFDKQLRAAEAEARAAQRGIWASSGPRHYPDYEERLRWWQARQAQVAAWETRCADKPGFVALGTEAADKKLRDLVGKDATVFGVLRAAIETKAKDRHVLLLDHIGRSTFGVVVFDPAVFGAIDIDALQGMFVQARGPVSLYKGTRPQMVIEKAEQLLLAPR